jgi:hypothetical protein
MFNPIADFMAMRRDISARSKLLGLWGFMLNVPTLIGALIFVQTLAGASVTAAILISLVIASQMHKRTPMSRLLGICHIVFLPALAVLFMEIATVDLTTAYGFWMIYSLVLMSICVLIDIFDLYRYFARGNATYIK